MRLTSRPSWADWWVVLAATALLAAVPGVAFAQQAVTERTTEFEFSVKSLSATTGQPLRVTIMNGGMFPHTMAFPEEAGPSVPAADVVQPGSTTSVSVTFSRPGTYEFWCPVGNHRERGMVGTITIAGAAAGGAAGRAGGMDPIATAAGLAVLGAVALGAGLLRRRGASL